MGYDAKILHKYSSIRYAKLHKRDKDATVVVKTDNKKSVGGVDYVRDCRSLYSKRGVYFT